MGSGVLLAALVVLWFVVLVPMVVTRGDAQGGRAELADSGPDAAAASDGGPRRPRARPSGWRSTATRCSPAVSCRSTCTRCGAARWPAWPRSPSLALVGALVYSPWLWAAQVVLDLAVVGYLLVLRKVGPPRAAGGPPGGPCRGPRGAPHAGPAARRAADARHAEPCARDRRRRRHLPQPAAPERAAGPGAPAAPRPGRRGPHAGPGRLAAQRRGRSGRRRHRFRRHRRVPAAPRRQRLTVRRPGSPAPPRWRRRSAGTVSCPSKGLWRSPVAHLVRIEGVRGSTPLSSTPSPHDHDAVGAPPRRRSPFGGGRVSAQGEPEPADARPTGSAGWAGGSSSPSGCGSSPTG